MTQLLTVKDAAEVLGVSPQFIYRHIDAGDLPVYRLGQGRKAPIRIDAEELAVFVVPSPAHRTRAARQ